MSAPIGFSPRSATGDRTVYLMALAAAAIALAFAVTTNQVWEDYYITFRISRNLVEGHGLVYQVGERVHAFTSPLGVLLPALGLWITGSDAGALLFFRVLSAAALAGAAIFVALHGRDHGWKQGSLWLAFILGILNSKTVAFAANGMETGLLVLFAALAWRELTRPDGPGPRWPALALGYGGLMWTRPDACVLAAAMTAGWWIFGVHSIEINARRAWWRKVGAALIAGGLLYAPWVLWTWYYYGSPVPQTVVAKAGIMLEGPSLLRVLLAPLRCLVESTELDGVFAPPYFYFVPNWPRDVINVFHLFARLSAFLWIAPTLPRSVRAASLAVLIGGVYFHQIMPYPWYYAPWTLLASLVLAAAGETVCHRWTGRIRAVGFITAGLLAAGSLGLLIAVTYTSRLQQHYVEDEGRRQIGLWLREHATSGNTVFLESLGYIGYFSQLKMLDVPGLSAPEVSRLIRSGRRDYASLIGALRPSWVVIRPREYFGQHLNENGGLRDYVLVKQWNVRPKLDAISFLPSRGSLEFDAEYLVFKRQDPKSSPLAPPS
jgi:hypothetical protein